MRFEWTRLKSLRARLLVFVSVPLIVVLGLSIISDYREGLDIARDAYDHTLVSDAVALASRLDRDDGALDLDLPREAEAVLRGDRLDKLYFAVIDEKGRVVAGDAQLRQLVMTDDEDNPVLYDGKLGNENLRLATYRFNVPGRNSADALIVVGETTRKRHDMAVRVAGNALRSNLLLILAALVAVYFGVHFALHPLDHLGRQIAQRSASDLSPVSRVGSPHETGSLLDALDSLLGKLRQAAAAQQAFISNAAHQLRTPLAQFQTQLELASRSPEGLSPERAARLHQAVTRLAHLTHQMLALARATPEAAGAVVRETVQLPALFEEIANQFLDRAVRRQIDLGFEAQECTVQGSHWMLRELLANLVDNALQYTPEGGHVTVRCGVDAQQTAWLEVEDNGPGIEPELRKHVLGRFVRAPDAPTGGSGLGLAIVNEVVQRHAAKLTLLDGYEGRGLCVRVEFAGSA